MLLMQSDTLSCDTVRLAYWQNNPAYDYNRELQTPGWDLYGWINMQLMKLLTKIFGSRFAEQYTEIILIVLFIVIVLLLVWFVYRKRPGVFARSGKKNIPYAVFADTIYGIDFQADITNALARRDYKEAGRLLYLQTLKSLSDNGIIDWQLYKTPTQYIYEVKPEERREPLRNLTNRFLRLRYGNFEVTEQLFDEMKQLQAEVQKEGRTS